MRDPSPDDLEIVVSILNITYSQDIVKCSYPHLTGGGP